MIIIMREKPNCIYTLQLDDPVIVVVVANEGTGGVESRAKASDRLSWTFFSAAVNCRYISAYHFIYFVFFSIVFMFWVLLYLDLWTILMSMCSCSSCIRNNY